MRDIREKNWFWLDNALVDREDIGAMEKLVYMLLARFADKDGKCFPSQEKLCKLTGIKDYRTIVKYMESLKEKGLLEIKKTKGKPNIYFLKNVNSEVPAKNVPTKFVDEVPAKNAGIVPTKFAGITKPIEQNPFEQDKKEKNKKEKSQTEVLTDYVDGLNLDTEKKEIFKKWIIYKKDNKQYKNTISIDSLIKKWGCYSSVELEKIVENSISNGYQGLFELKKGFTKSEEKRINHQATGVVKTKPDSWWEDL